MKLPSYISLVKDPAESLQNFIKSHRPDHVAFLVDENTRRDCLHHLKTPEDSVIIEINSGESNKNLQTCELIWSELTGRNFTRKSLLVNVGGGVIGDMGGFAASTYKRGIAFINFPTTLLAAVDANIGGKLGVDFHGYKNHIGLFRDPAAVFIWTGFLDTLPVRELRSGFAEVIKHAIIRDRDYWTLLRQASFPDLRWKKIIERSVEIKGEVVSEDYEETGLRKILNYGHTLGHAIESWYLTNGKSLLHGEAISAGMVMEASLSFKNGLIGEETLQEISGFITKIFGTYEIPPVEVLVPIMLQDKKNRNQQISFSLPNKIGSCLYDQMVALKYVEEGVDYYNSLK